MATEQPHLAVVGCGVIGLSSGIRLLEHGFQVTILARDLPPETTSNMAGAYWAPSSLYGPAHVRVWSQRGYHDLCELAQDPASGVVLKTLVELSDMPLPGLPRIDLIPDLRRVEPDRFGSPCRYGYQLTVPTVDPPIYMAFLVERFRALGGTIEQRPVADLTGLTADYALLVNCSGLGAGELAHDPLVFPIRGQTIWLSKPAGLSPDVVDCSGGNEFTYVIPRRGEVLLGGTFDDHDWRLEPDPAIGASILRRCTQLTPPLAEGQVLAHKVGLRPGRPSVRLELERVAAGRAIIHNYGHGAIGHTLAWGCAAEVVARAEEFLQH